MAAQSKTKSQTSYGYISLNNPGYDLAYLEMRGVQDFVHFTPASNLYSILEHGIIPRSELDNQGISYAYTDSSRYEGKGFINLSVTNPNIKMFYGKRKDFPNHTFAVITLKPSLLESVHGSYSFRSTNSASRLAQPCSVEELFAGSRPEFFDQSWPTDNQAEVLINSVIDPSYIKTIEFPAEESSNQETVELAFKLENLIATKNLSCKVLFCDKHFDYNKSFLGELDPKEAYEYYFASWSANENAAVASEESINRIERKTVFDSIALSNHELSQRSIFPDQQAKIEDTWELRFHEPGEFKERSNGELSAFAVVEKIVNRGKVTRLSEPLEQLLHTPDEIKIAHRIQSSLVELVKHQTLAPGMQICLDGGELASFKQVVQASLDDLTDLCVNVCNLYSCPSFLDGVTRAEDSQVADIILTWSNDASLLEAKEARIVDRRRANQNIRFDFTRVVEPAEINEDIASLLFLFNYIFRFDGFREGQLEGIRRGLRRQDTIVLLPTGSGKSVVYQFLSLITPGIAFVVCPIISLIEDQVTNLRRQGIDRTMGISSTLSSKVREDVLEGVTTGQHLICYVAPERFQNRRFNSSVKRYASTNVISTVAVDEAHCVSEWGHDFRTAYLGLAATCRDICSTGDVTPPLLALTGTASTSVLIDMMNDLGITDDTSIIQPSSFDRPEIHYRILRVNSEHKQEALAELIERTIPSEFDTSFEEFYLPVGEDSNCGIVFCPHVNGSYGIMASEAALSAGHAGVWDFLARRLPGGAFCSFYSGSAPKRLPSEENSAKHADQDNQEESMYARLLWAIVDKHPEMQEAGNISSIPVNRDEAWNQRKRELAAGFKENRATVMVATKAFGMGIDKPNIRWVIHYGMPGSLESYYQEVGRAARDRKTAYAYLILSDDYPEFNEELLDPARTPVTAMATKDKDRKGKWGGDDISRVAFFHANTFEGVNAELEMADSILSECGRDNWHEGQWYVPFNRENKESRERAIYRFRILGVFQDYAIDYTDFGSGSFVITPSLRKGKDLREHIINCYLGHVKAYQSDHAYLQAARTNLLAAVKNASDDREFIMAAMSHLLSNFVYKVLEEGRRRATLTMLEAAEEAASAGSRKAVDDMFRQQLLSYLSTGKQDEEGQGIQALLNDATNLGLLQSILTNQLVVDPQSLLGQSSRLLEDYPQHYGLHFIQAAVHCVNGDRTRFRTSVNSMVEFGTNNYGLSLDKCEDNFLAFLNSDLAIDLPAEKLDACLPAMAESFNTNTETLLSKMASEHAPLLSELYQLCDIACMARRGL